MSDKVYKAGNKIFLSQKYGEYGAICWEVRASRYDDKDNYMTANIRLQDCYRNINLDFWVGDSEERFESRMDKLNTLIDELTDMRRHMTNAFASMEAANKDIPEKLNED